MPNGEVLCINIKIRWKNVEKTKNFHESIDFFCACIANSDGFSAKNRNVFKNSIISQTFPLKTKTFANNTNNSALCVLGFRLTRTFVSKLIQNKVSKKFSFKANSEKQSLKVTLRSPTLSRALLIDFLEKVLIFSLGLIFFMFRGVY